jgi:hypothetical protein
MSLAFHVPGIPCPWHSMSLYEPKFIKTSREGEFQYVYISPDIVDEDNFVGGV